MISSLSKTCHQRLITTASFTSNAHLHHLANKTFLALQAPWFRRISSHYTSKILSSSYIQKHHIRNIPRDRVNKIEHRFASELKKMQNGETEEKRGNKKEKDSVKDEFIKAFGIAILCMAALSLTDKFYSHRDLQKRMTNLETETREESSRIREDNLKTLEDNLRAQQQYVSLIRESDSWKREHAIWERKHQENQAAWTRKHEEDKLSQRRSEEYSKNYIRR